MSSSSYSRKTKNDSDVLNSPSVKSVEVDDNTKVKKKKVTKKKQKAKIIQQPPLHFDFNFASSSSRPKEIAYNSDDAISTTKAKSVYNSSVVSKRADNVSTISTSSKQNLNQNVNINAVKLPPPTKPNFIRANQENVIKANFDDRWQLFLEMKAMDEARDRIYFRVYFKRWRKESTSRFLRRIKEKTSSFESANDTELIVKSSEKEKDKETNADADNAIELINKARKKYDEYASFLSEFEGQVSSFYQEHSSKRTNINNIVNVNITKNENANISNNQNQVNSSEVSNNDNLNNDVNKKQVNASFNSKNNFYINKSQYQNHSINNQSSLSKEENEEVNFSAIFNENDNNSSIYVNKLKETLKKNLNNSEQETNKTNSQVCEFDFTDSSDNLLKIDTPPPSNPNSFVEPRPPSDASDSGEMPKSEVQISMDSITVDNEFCDMVDNSIIKSKELAIKTKAVLADDEWKTSSDVEKEIKNHSFIHEKKRRYISSSSSDNDEEFLPRALIRYAKNHDLNSSLADSFYVSRANFDKESELNFSRSFPSDLYDEILSPLPVKKVKFAMKKKKIIK